jgi:ectoine hydroxylase-related dioxygenase (phytanoyl-CoA dioxygenase family)
MPFFDSHARRPAARRRPSDRSRAACCCSPALDLASCCAYCEMASPLTAVAAMTPRPNETAEDLAAHTLALRTHGVSVVADVLGTEALSSLRSVVAELMASTRELHPGQQPQSVEYTNMCCNLVNHRHELFAPLMLRPAVHTIVRALLGDDALLSTAAALEPRAGAVGPDGGHVQSLHRDGHADEIQPVAKAQALQTLWLLDDIAPRNGGTRFLLRSHHGLAGTEAEPVQLSAPVGSMVIYDSRTLHGMSNNLSGERRRALACFFTRYGLPQMCDQRVYLNPSVQRSVCDPAMRRVLGLDVPVDEQPLNNEAAAPIFDRAGAQHNTPPAAPRL